MEDISRALTDPEQRGRRLCGDRGEARPSSSDLQGRLQHLHEEGVNGGVADQLEEEEVLQALQPDGPQRWQAQEEFGKPGRRGAVRGMRKVLSAQSCLFPSL